MPLLNTLVVSVLPLIPKPIVGRVAKRYIAGISLSDGVQTVRKLNQKMITATMDLLGEDVKDAGEANNVRSGILTIVRAIREQHLDSGVSLKPTQLGLTIDTELAYQNVRSIIEEAAKDNIFVRIDMEDAATTDATLALYRRLRSDGFTNTGVVIQAYLKRSVEDVRSLLKVGTNFRLCKGIYNEAPSIAYKQRQEIRNNYLTLLRMMLEAGAQVGIATHDDFLIDGAYKLIQTLGVKREKYEFQMLLGVREKKRDEIVRHGNRLRVYVPFGEQWYAYSTRRLKENPHMAWYITKAVFIRS